MGLFEQLHRVYARLQKAIYPELRYSQLHYEDVLVERVALKATWLDVGCGRRLLPPWRGDAERSILSRPSNFVGIDLDFDSLLDNRIAHGRSMASVQALPFGDETFDLVTANMVVEHLSAPEVEFREVRRVLRKDGLFVFHTPNASAYPTLVARMLPDGIKRVLARVLESRASKDVFPTFYRANTPDAVRRLAGDCGLEVVELRMVSTSAAFAVIAPLAVVELLYFRRLAAPKHADRRSNIIAVLRRSDSCTTGPDRPVST